MFFHNADNFITIKSENNQIQNIPLSEFLKLEPEYSLPEKILWRQYIKGKRHILNDGINQTGAEFPWKEGDFYISRIENYKKEIIEKETLDQKKSRAFDNLMKAINSDYDKGVDFETKNYPFHCIEPLMLSLSIYKGEVPESFILRTSSGDVFDFRSNPENKNSSKKDLDFLISLASIITNRKIELQNKNNELLLKIRSCKDHEELKSLDIFY
jgi:hypothetical protein